MGGEGLPGRGARGDTHAVVMLDVGSVKDYLDLGGLTLDPIPSPSLSNPTV